MEVEAIYSPTIMDGPVVRFQFGLKRGTYREIVSGKDRTDWSAEINASRNGVSLNADYFPVLSTAEAIEAVQKVFREAWSAYQKMRLSPDAHESAKRIVDEFNKQTQEGIIPLTPLAIRTARK